MTDKNTYYESKCEYGGLILCKTCAEWDDKADKTIQEHRVYAVTCVTQQKRWSAQKTTKTDNCMKTILTASYS